MDNSHAVLITQAHVILEADSDAQELPRKILLKREEE